MDDVAGLLNAREADIHRLAPHGVVYRAWLDAVERRHHPLVLGGIEGLVGLHKSVAFAVAVGVDDDRGPALRLHVGAGGVVHLGVEPPDNAAGRTALADP